jgi:signal transduction histidine kinase
VRAPRLSGIAAAVAVAVLSIAAAHADLDGGASQSAAVLDVAVGIAFAVAGFAAGGSQAERLVVAGVGAAWLAGSVLPEARSLHQGVLACALLAFPAGRILGATRLPLAAAAVAVALQLVPQLGVAALFAAVAAVAPARTPSARAAFPAAAGAIVAGTLLYAWWGARRDVTVPPLVAYEAALLVVAALFVAATRALPRTAGRLADLAFRGEPGTGLPGLAVVLGGLLGDPELRIDLWDPVARCYAGAVRPTAQRRALVVPLEGAPAARVVTTAAALADPPTAAAVRAAVALAVANHRLRAAHARRVDELHASRLRLLTATDRERDRAAAALRIDVIAALDRAAAALDGGAAAVASRALLDEAVAGIAVAAADVRRIVVGAPPSALGSGRLRAALDTLAMAAPVPVSVTVDGAPAATEAVETALFYVCSEALTNIAKHAAARRAWIRLSHPVGRLVLEIGDDGRGGADHLGSGLHGLADRLAAHGGGLRVRSPRGGGTLVTATIPVSLAGDTPAAPSTAPPRPPRPLSAPPPWTAP